LIAFIAQVGIELGYARRVPTRWVTVGAENLLAHQRHAIERMFGVTPRQHYGLAEGVANISECPQGTLHVDEDYSFVEFIPREHGFGHRIVGTSLDNSAIPFLRYDTGDIATIDEHGYLALTDRAKDVIKSGGEWISSIDLENAAMAHPAVAMAAVIGVKHPRWEERPLLFIVCKPDQPLEGDEVLAFLAQRVAKWWIPDAVIFLESLPVGGTGKVQKAILRNQYAGYFD